MEGDALRAFAKDVLSLPGLRIRGLMCVPPYVAVSEMNRQYFVNLRHLLVDICRENEDNRQSMDLLSMGMTGDYEIAVEEGATHVRVGSGIFGEREYGSL